MTVRPAFVRRASVLRSVLALSVALLVAGVPAAAAAAPLRVLSPQGTSQVTVRLAPGVTVAQARALASSHQAVLVGTLGRTAGSRGGALLCLRSDSRPARSLAASLRGDPRVAAAFADRPITADATYPNDASFRSQWGMYRIAAPLAWDLTTGLTGAAAPVVADIDSGVSYTHDDLAANMWTNPGEVAWNGVDDDGNGYVDDVHGIDAFNRDGDPLDDHYHGTHTSGIAGAVGDNGIGVAGVSWDVRIMALKALGANLVGTNSAALECVNYVIDQKVNHGVNVVAINASWGGAPYPEDAALRDAIAAAGRAGIVWCASAGNDGLDNDVKPRFPSSYDVATILAVAATDSTDLMASWSNFGAASVDLGAPGVNVLSTRSGNTYTWLGGTSQAAPHVAGAVALCAALHPDETALQRVDRILTGVDPLASLAGKVVSGGRLNAFRSLTADLRPATEVLGAGEDWRSGPVEVRLRASDGTGIGVERTEYSLDGAAVATGDTVTVAGDGVHVLAYRSVDKAGNEEDLRSATIRVDSTAPQVTAEGAGEGWLKAPATVRLGVADATSGIASWRFAVDGGAWTVPAASTADVAVAGDGVHTLAVEAWDAAGNTTAKNLTVRIDSVAPSTTGLTSSGQRDRTVSLYYRINDALPSCGQAVVTDLVVKNSKGAVVRRFSNLGTVGVNQTLSCSFLCTLAAGNYRFTVSAYDVAGNVAATTTAGTLVVKK